MSLRSVLSLLLLAVAVPTGAILAAPPVPPPEAAPKLDVPYVPTPDAVLDQMLEFAAPTKDDFLIDLGSGDGRIPITAAKRHGTRGFGVDLDPRRVAEARSNAEKEGVTDKVTFRQANLFDTEIREATVLTLYLLPAVNIRLRPRILDELRPGTRVVSHDFDMGDWKPDRVQQLGASKRVYFWIVPAKVAGKWTVSDKATGRDFLIEVDQEYQAITGKATIDGRIVPLRNATVEGERIIFEVAADGSQPKRYEGRLRNNAIEGDNWQAKPAT
jgi:hypothetical protein